VASLRLRCHRFLLQTSDPRYLAVDIREETFEVHKYLSNNSLISIGATSSSTNKEILEQFQKNQIFLGIVGVKHHKK
jgi:hypothetical protein